MDEVQVEQKSYQMPPREGFTVAHFSPWPTSTDRPNFMKRSSAEHSEQRRWNGRRAHQDRKHLADSQRRRRTHTGQTNGNARRPPRSR